MEQAAAQTTFDRFDPSFLSDPYPFYRMLYGQPPMVLDLELRTALLARYADVVLAGSLMEEDEGTTTNVEGRVIRHRKVITPPGEAREDWRIICDLAKRC